MANDHISIGNVKNLVPNFFDKEKYVLHYNKLQLYFAVKICDHTAVVYFYFCFMYLSLSP